MYLVEIYSNKLARYRGENEDLYQQGSIGLLEAIKRYDATQGSFKTFATSYIVGYMKQHYQITEIITVNRNKWRENKKKIIDISQKEIIDFNFELEEKCIYAEELQQLYKNIKKLNNGQKLIIKLMLQGKKATEIAQILNCSRQYVYKSFNQAVDELKGMML
ncbi:MAG: sigma-70 family RNA polymerase sigma factor [Cetobacterium sp.]